MTDHVGMFAAFCGSPASGGAALYVALFIGGLMGSVAHCVPMCGPFVLAQVSNRLAAIPVACLCERRRLRSRALLSYHAGRLTTYAALGAIAASAGAIVRTEMSARWVQPAFLLIGASLFAAQALRQFAPNVFLRGFRRTRRRSNTSASVSTVSRLFLRIAAVGKRVDTSRSGGAFVLGILLGFLPCGLLYAALALAAADGDVLGGAIGMLAFGAGTIPVLMLLGILGQTLARRWSATLRSLGPGLLLADAALLVALAWVRSDQLI